MAFKPSDRIKGEIDEELTLNLNSMMDMFAVLIPALLMMSAVVEVSTLTVKAPGMDASSNETPPPQPDKPPLSYTVSILESGYLLTGTAPPLTQAQPGPGSAPTIPLLDKSVICSRYRGTWPPPRSKNQERPKCDLKNGMEQRAFFLYDVDALTRKTMELKDAYPEERRIIITPGPETEYEAIVDVMDATRDVKEADGSVRVLFDEVVISPSLL